MHERGGGRASLCTVASGSHVLLQVFKYEMWIFWGELLHCSISGLCTLIPQTQLASLACFPSVPAYLG